MRIRFALLWIVVFSSQALAGEVPAENLQPELKASIRPFDDKAVKLLAAIQSGDFAAAEPLFFPEDPFVELKGIAKPLDYYKQLMSWYQKDFAKEQGRLQNRGELVFKGIRGGSCVWKKVGTEANKIAYWSCYRRKLDVLVGGKVETIEIKAMINWGQEWFITHLAPIPK